MEFKVGDRVIPQAGTTVIWRNQPGTVEEVDPWGDIHVRHDFEADQPPVQWKTEELEAYND